MTKHQNSDKLVRLGVVQPIGPDSPPVTEPDMAKIVTAAKRNVAHLCGLVAEAGSNNVDIACLPEDVGGIAHIANLGEDRSRFRQLVDETAEHTLAAFAQAARTARVHIVGTTCLPEGNQIYNAAFLIGPDGGLIGVYRKTHLPPGEDRFLSEGTEYPVFETEFGRVGMLICWDLMFPESARILALNGADVILCPTLGFDFGGEHIGEMRLRTRAFDNVVYLATATYASPACSGPGRSCIAGPQGELLADAGHVPDVVVWADVPLRRKPPDVADPKGKDGFDMWGRFLHSRRPATYGRLTE